jgi:hypothetical protein
MMLFSGCVYYESRVESDFQAYDVNFPGRLPVEMDFSISYDGKNYSAGMLLQMWIQTHTEKLTLDFYQPTDQYQSVKILEISVLTKDDDWISLPIIRDAQPLEHTVFCYGGEGYTARYQFPVSLEAEGKMKIQISGEYQSKDESIIPFVVEDEIHFRRKRRIIHILQVYAEV